MHIAIDWHCINIHSHVVVRCSVTCDSLYCRTPGFPALHCLQEFAQIHVHWVRDAIQPSNSLPSPSPQSFPASGSFPVSRLLASGGHSIGVSASASVLLMNIQGLFPLGLTGLISLLSQGLSSVFSSTTVWKTSVLLCSASFMVQLSYLYMTIGKTIALTIWTFVNSDVSAF